MPYNSDGNGPEMDEEKVVGRDYHIIDGVDGVWSPAFENRILAERFCDWLNQSI